MSRYYSIYTGSRGRKEFDKIVTEYSKFLDQLKSFKIKLNKNTKVL
jgi:hypothetical protein